MSDLILRQAAIDAVSRGCEEFREIFAECEKNLNELPSAQQELLFEIQNILEYLDTALHPIISPEHWNVYSELYDMISTLPFARPDIIHCKDCKHWMPYDWMFSEVVRSTNMDDYSEDEIGCAYCDMNMGANDFCSRRERREDE